MKIKRFLATDMRQAMREVREDQGADAVILSTRRLDDGIEIIAAVDYDEALVREAARHGAPMPDTSGVAAKPVTPPPMPLPPSEFAQLQPIVEQSALEAARMRVELLFAHAPWASGKSSLTGLDASSCRLRLPRTPSCSATRFGSRRRTWPRRRW